MTREQFISTYRKLFNEWTSCKDANIPGLIYSHKGGQLAAKLAEMYDENPGWVDQAEDEMLADYQLNKA